MTQKHTLVSILLLICASAAFSQTQQVTLNSQPSRAVGQPQLAPVSGNANRVEGREFWGPQNVALDTSGSTPAVYVSDLRNNRVLAWKNATGFSNGAKADLVIDQPDFFSTSPQGPGGTYPTGLLEPTGVAVYKGDLYVADSGNNRVLRYPKPFNQQGSITPDLWLGQPSLNARTPNYTGAASEKGLALFTSGGLYQASIAFDAGGNLWMTDPGNARVLRYPATQIGCSNCTASADIVIGQPNMTTVQTPALTTAQSTVKNQFGLIDGLAFDSTGRLYVTDQIANAQGRVLVFASPASQPGNLSADRIMGIIQVSQLAGMTPAEALAFQGQTFLGAPGAVFVLPDNSVGVVDSGLHRITIFPPYEQWPAESKYFSPQATSVVGQTSTLLSNTIANQFPVGGSAVTPPPSAATLANPTSAAFLASTKELFVVDSGNNRMIVLPQSGTGFGPATRVLGQDRMNQYSPNLVEGKEFNFFVSGSYADASIALDTTTSTPHLWVADTHNHRVLGFKDARNLSATTVADIVIGQPDLATALCNYPTGDLNNPSQNNLCAPVGLAVDAKGNLYVADSGNARVLRFQNPWASGLSASQPADLVLGQASFTLSIRQPSNTTMGVPYGLAFSGSSGLVISDQGYNRVVFIPFSANGTFAAGTDNGRAATKVFGQPDFKTITSGSNLSQLNSPHLVACDTNGQIYVTDTGNNRVMIFGDPNNPQTSSQAILSLPGLNAPRGIYVNSGTGEIWVANTGSGTFVRYPKYDSLLFNANPTATFQDVVNNTLIPAIAVAQDQYGDLFAADAENRVAVYYQGFTAVNGATQLARPVAPGMIATLYPLASATQFGSNTATNSSPTWPTTLGDVQVVFNGTPAPLYFVSPGQINFLVPQGAPAGSSVEVEVIQASTGQVLGAQLISINTVSPGIYTTCQANQTGTLREACVLNEDNSVNSATNPAPRGSVIQIFGTGQGLVSNPPADGSVAGGSPLSTTLSNTRVGMNVCNIDDCGPPLPGDVGTSTSHSASWVSFSGLTPGLVGLWQVNAQIPMAIPPTGTFGGGQTILFVTLNGVPSFDTTSGFKTTFYVK